MKPEAQRIAIAKACGFTDITFSPLMGFHQQKSDERAKECGGRWRFALPDYLTDLDAMHEAEKILSDPQIDEYKHRLMGAITDKERISQCATAAQRAEAFLRILNLWTD